MRFQAITKGGAWKVVDTENMIKVRGWYSPAEPYHMQWCVNEQEAREVAANLNATRGHAVDEPKCCVCGAQPAGGDEHYPRCGPCWSKISD